ncbi:MAG: TonB-dependent receptor plug domain-containing protein, partial [Parasutterella excrementihominis]
EQQLLEVPMAVTVVTNQEIQESAARNVGELLEDIPGVMVNNAGSQGLKRVSIRGEDTFRTLTLIDGQKISEQKSMSGASILIDPNSIERIEVIKGPASVLYGSDALGGVVNIITKKDLRNLLKLRVRLLGTAPVTVGQKRFLSVEPIKV